MRHHTRTASRESGFTLPELISVMAVTLLLSGLIMYFAFQYWRSSATVTNDLETFVGRLNAGDRLRDTMNQSSGLITQNGLADTHATVVDPSDGTGTYWVPVHAIPGNIPVGTSGATPLVYFRSPSIDTSKNIVMNGTQPYEDEFVLYLDSATKELRMRTLANPGALNNARTTSCPPASATSSCPADRVMATNLISVDMRYFSRTGNTIDYTSIVDPLTGDYIGPDFPAVEVIEFNLHVFKKSTLHGGADTSSQTVIRVALRNS